MLHRSGRRVTLAVGFVIGLVGSADAQIAPLGAPAPEIAGGPWINSALLTLSVLRGRMVLIDFWAYGRINCQHVIPQLRPWHERYQGAGLTVVGIHSPEFFWERGSESVAAAVEKVGIHYPVVPDNDHAIRNRYGIRGWPTTLLVDRKGIVRYRHIGEGAYQETEAMIQRLLAETGG